MPPARPLSHVDAEKKDDETLRVEARAHLAEAPSLQLVAELLARLRAADLPFWSPDVLRARWNAAERMRWFRQRPDVRQKITTSLTGLAPKAARKKMAEFQAALIDSVIDEGDIPVRAFEESFAPADLAIYGPAAAFWHAVRERFPWREDTPVHQELMAWLLKALLADTSHIPGLARVPILTPWDLRTSIEGRVWHTRVPLEVRVAIDDARFSQERDRPGAPFHAQDDLAIAVPEIIAASIPLRDLAGVLDAAERAMGFDREAPRPKGPPDLRPPSMAPPGPGASPTLSPPMPPPPATPAGLGVPPPSGAAAPPQGPSATPPQGAIAAHAQGATPPPGATPPQAATPPPATVVFTPAAAAAPPRASSAPSAAAEQADGASSAERDEEGGRGGDRAQGASRGPMATIPELRRGGPHPGVPTLEDELERTNPWVVPSAEDLAGATSDEPASDLHEHHPPRRRRR